MSEFDKVGPEDKEIFEEKHYWGEFVHVHGILCSVEHYDDGSNLVCVKYEESAPEFYIEEGDRSMFPVSMLKEISNDE